MVTLRDNKDHIRVLLYCEYTTFTRWVVLLSNTAEDAKILIKFTPDRSAALKTLNPNL